MTTYNEYISQFPLKEREEKLEGYEYHHVIPKCVQEKEGISDRSGVLLLPSQHFYAHVLYDIENKTETAKYMLSKANLRLEDISCYEDCLIFDQIAERCKSYQSSHNYKNKLPVPKEWVIDDYISGITTKDISQKYNISRSYIYNILRTGPGKRVTKDNLENANKIADLQLEIKDLKNQIKLLEESNRVLTKTVDKLLNY